MKYIVEHYGPALVAIAVMVALAALIVGMLTNNGVLATQFSDALSTFFTKMNEATGI